MNLTDEIEKLQQMHDQGVLTDDEFTGAKDKLIHDETAAVATVDQSRSDTANLQRQLNIVSIQNEINKLDNEWQIERQSLMARGRYGSTYVPSAGSALLGGGLMAVVGIVFCNIPGRPDQVGPVLYGVIMFVFGIVIAVTGCNRAAAYEAANNAYQSKRADLMARLEQAQHGAGQSMADKL